MQEQVNEKSVSLIIRGTKISGQILAKALNKLLADMKNKPAHSYKGKQSLKNLVKQGAGVTNIEINDDNIKSFERVARKYGVDFALKKDSGCDPPRWLVFFKSRDMDALTAAFREYSAKSINKSRKPSIIKSIRKMKELSKSLIKDTIKKKENNLER